MLPPAGWNLPLGGHKKSPSTHIGSRGDTRPRFHSCFSLKQAGNGAKPEGICIPLAPGRTFPSLPVGRLAVGGLPSLSGSAGGTLPVPREMKFSHQYLTTAGIPCQEKGGAILPRLFPLLRQQRQVQDGPQLPAEGLSLQDLVDGACLDGGRIHHPVVGAQVLLSQPEAHPTTSPVPVGVQRYG